MVWSHTAATLAPSLLPLVVVYLLWTVIDEAPQVAGFVFLLSLLPVLTQVCWWAFRDSKPEVPAPALPPHPFGIVLPLGLLLVIPLWPVGEAVARHFPSLCVTSAAEPVRTSRPEGPTGKARFFVHFSGWGNPQSFEMTSAEMHYTGDKAEALYVRLPDMRGHYSNSYTTYFTVTRAGVADYVRRSDDFPAAEAEAVAEELWGLLHRYREKRDTPPMIDHFCEGEGPRIVWYVPPSTIYLCSSFLSVLVLAVASWLLARWYCRRVLASRAGGRQNRTGIAEPT